MKIKPQLILVVGFVVVALSAATYASIVLIRPKSLAWAQVSNIQEFSSVFANNLNSKEITKSEAAESTTVQRFDERYTVYRFRSKKTCGRRGCLHVVLDNKLQRQKSFVLAVPAEKESYMFTEDGCVVAVQLDLAKVKTKYPLCLKLN